ncbi:branched-chain amino acid ABC transporter permease [Curtobacterium flaccumfaciens pv. flaccumfaciens]|uniref:branched-chain amino acid ABC transporter permease n=1 Tax=Curtobacterium TaxID=2034 RepID=UPI000B2BCFC2|nr:MULTISPECIES: branched-chain amino acid ABC transporter permease [Curtobacterium]MCE0456690.1 branched-chain amino acid ABC transporter permease [Curtobacterium allii]MCS5492713.1 branched-chain amino acid ABC transporter permease [Curtobacterium flaccumfaciens pv. flaccumfaciens]MCS5508935.1 branched-chain amino acid ABC transporter permease [Curtobacterium flaccumfaciens pv. flaccumfaciens]MCX2786257.1 branched-chain amino acid ABC transporter permease [Curtobacterium flaccumfaciens pv. fl
MGSITPPGRAQPRLFRLRHARRRPVLAAVLVAAFLATFLIDWAVTLPAFSATSAPATSQACTVSPDNGCIQGTITDSEREPAEGVDVDVTGPSGFDQTATTNGDGRWSVSVDTAGEYTVSVDQGTLPKGQYLTNAADAERKVQATLNANVGQIFQLSDQKGATTSTDSSGVSIQRAWQQFASGLRLGLLIALASIGLSLIYGTTGLSSFSHGEQVTLGGLLAYVFANQLGWNIWVTGIVVTLLCAATGYLQDAAIWRPLRRRRISLTQLMIVTIGLSIAAQYAFQYFFGASTVRIQQGNPETVRFAGVTLTVQSYVAMGIALVVLVATGLFLAKTRFGRATRAVSDNPALAAASGIDVDRVIRFVWTLAAGLAGLSGVMLGLVLNGVNWQTGLQLLLLMFASVTLGGLGTAYGALVGSMIIGVVVELTNLVLPGDFKYATALVILILILLFRPQGIFGRAERIG